MNKSFFWVLSSIFTLTFALQKTAPAKIDGRKAVIFCLHDIDKGGPYSITSRELKEIFDLLKNRYEVLSLQTWSKKLENNEPFSKPPVILTFDDGNPSIKKIITPLLIQYGYGATFFIYLERYADHSTFYTFLKELPETIEVGSHSFQHLDMRSLYKKSPAEFYKEIYLSRKKLEYLIQKKVISWAWPYGSYAQDMVDLAKKAGYKIQVSTSYKKAFYGKNEIFSRFTLENEDPVGMAKTILRKNFPGL